MSSLKKMSWIFLLIFAALLISPSSDESKASLSTQISQQKPLFPAHVQADNPEPASLEAALSTMQGNSSAHESEASLPSLLENYLLDSVPSTPKQLTWFAMNPEEGLLTLQEALASEDVGQQYQAIRLAGELHLQVLQPELESLALNPLEDPALRTAACHALKSMPLDPETQAALLELSRQSEDPIVSRSALVALASSSLVSQVDSLENLLTHDDPLMRTYAWRLLSQESDSPSFESLSPALESESAFVRRESYAALADSNNPQAYSLLQSRLSRESDEGTLAMGLCDLQALELRLAGREDSMPDLVIEKAASPLFSEQHWAYNQVTADPSLLPRLMSQSSLLPHNWASWIRACVAALFSPSEAAESEEDAFEKHEVPVHYEHADFALSRYAELNPDFPLSVENRILFLLANSAEDNDIRPINHAYNPLTGRGFLWRKNGIGGSALEYCKTIEKEMAHQSERELWSSAARIFHVLQDMTSPTHVYGIWHPFQTSLYENYWSINQEEVAPLLLAAIPEILLPSESAETEAWHLDAFTRTRIQKRISGLGGTMADYIESLAWQSYFATSYWGALSFSEEAIQETLPPIYFTDGRSPESDNSLARVFDGNIHYRSSWYGHYFAATDRKGREFYWNRGFLLDSFRPCANDLGQRSQDAHCWLSKNLTLWDRTTVAGRFVFLQRGFFAKHCRPPFYPDGTAMTEHLSQYHGNILIPACLRYGLGQLDQFYKAFLMPEKKADNPEEALAVDKAAPLPYRSDLPGNTSPFISSSNIRPTIGPDREPGTFHESGEVNFYREDRAFLTKLREVLALFSGGCAPF